jgi:hypothetical protein
VGSPFSPLILDAGLRPLYWDFKGYGKRSEFESDVSCALVPLNSESHRCSPFVSLEEHHGPILCPLEGWIGPSCFGPRSGVTASRRLRLGGGLNRITISTRSMQRRSRYKSTGRTVRESSYPFFLPRRTRGVFPLRTSSIRSDMTESSASSS